MRMHQSSPTPSSVTSNGDDNSSQVSGVDVNSSVDFCGIEPGLILIDSPLDSTN